jgi:hypothetical protein
MDDKRYGDPQSAAYDDLPVQQPSPLRRTLADAAPKRQPRPSPDTNEFEMLAAGGAALVL